MQFHLSVEISQSRYFNLMESLSFQDILVLNIKCFLLWQCHLSRLPLMYFLFNFWKCWNFTITVFSVNGNPFILMGFFNGIINFLLQWKFIHSKLPQMIFKSVWVASNNYKFIITIFQFNINTVILPSILWLDNMSFLYRSSQQCVIKLTTKNRISRHFDCQEDLEISQSEYF